MTALYMKEILLMAKWMDWEHCTMRWMNHYMKVNGKMIIHMELEERRIVIQFMKVNLKMVKCMDEEHANTEKNIRKMFMRVNGKMITLMDLELIPLETEVFIKVNTPMI